MIVCPLQERLIDLGYDLGPVDGILANRTLRALLAHLAPSADATWRDAFANALSTAFIRTGTWSRDRISHFLAAALATSNGLTSVDDGVFVRATAPGRSAAKAALRAHDIDFGDEPYDAASLDLTSPSVAARVAAVLWANAGLNEIMDTDRTGMAAALKPLGVTGEVSEAMDEALAKIADAWPAD